MFHNLKRKCSDSEEKTGKPKYNTRSKDKRHDDVHTLSQSAKDKLDLLTQLRSKKVNKNQSDENKNKLFNKWSLLSSDEEIDRMVVDKSNNCLMDANDRSRSASLAPSFSSSKSSEDYSSSDSSCSYGKSMKHKKYKKNKRKDSLSDCSDGERSSHEKLTSKNKKHIKTLTLTDNSEEEDAKNKSNENLSNINSEEFSEEDSNKDASNDEKNLKKIKSKHKYKKPTDGDSFVLQASSQVNLSRKDSTSDNNKLHKSDSFGTLTRKDRHKSNEKLGPMHFTTHETVNADPNLVSNLSHDISKKCKEFMKEVKDDIKAITKLKKEKEVVHRISKHLLNIGNHINHVLIKYKDPEQIREWRGNLWSYVSHYSYYDSFRLLKIYKNLLRIQETENDKKNHEVTDVCGNDYSGWNYKNNKR